MLCPACDVLRSMGGLGVRAARSLRAFRMSRRHLVVARMKNQRLAVEAVVALDLADEDEVVAAVVLPLVAAGEAGDDAIEQRHAGCSVAAVHPAELVRLRRREL